MANVVENLIYKLLNPQASLPVVRTSGFGVVDEGGNCMDVSENELQTHRARIKRIKKQLPDKEAVREILTGKRTASETNPNENAVEKGTKKSLSQRIIDTDGYEEIIIAPGLNIYQGEETKDKSDILLEDPPPPVLFRPRIYIPPDEDSQGMQSTNQFPNITTQFNGQKLYNTGTVLVTTHKSGLFKLRRFPGDETFFIKPESHIKVVGIESGQINPKNEVFETNCSSATPHYLLEGMFVVKVDHENKKFYTQRIQLQLPGNEVNTHFVSAKHNMRKVV